MSLPTLGIEEWWSWMVIRIFPKKKFKKDGEEQKSRTDANLNPKEVTQLSIEKYCVACVSEVFLHDLQQRFVKVESSQNLPWSIMTSAFETFL
ncbi:hypothetical protein DPMN_085809 [Dreissena polymorpha]|uniref:Uncharacterized protein n=1 Tax=Dreissena polymorpha TaxID=45954 RepID=A0A9D4BJR4_DREPO|nr:hypothetical protein DPMN_085809 [Dreissena polymorpha]